MKNYSSSSNKVNVDNVFSLTRLGLGDSTKLVDLLLWELITKERKRIKAIRGYK